MTQHNYTVRPSVLPAYEVDTLGAPFRVTLLDSVQVRTDEETDKQMIHIPDFVGMVNAVARCRAVHPRKLSGDDIFFLRKALGVKAKALSAYLDISPEHFSRCESNTKVLSSSTERMLRLFTFLATFYESPQDLLAKLEGVDGIVEPVRKGMPSNEGGLGEAFLQYFLTLKIQTVFPADEALHFKLQRICAHDDSAPCVPESEEGNWQKAA